MASGEPEFRIIVDESEEEEPRVIVVEPAPEPEEPEEVPKGRGGTYVKRAGKLFSA